MTINKATCTAPTNSSPNKIYTGSAISSGITCPSSCSTASGTQSATNIGEYTHSCALKSKTNYKWNDDTTDSKSYTWYINNAKVVFNKVNCDSTTSTLYSRTGQTKMSSDIRNTTYGTNIPTASKTGYHTNGWYTAASGGSQVLTSANGFTAVSGYTSSSAWALTANRDLYAHCEANKYKIKYYIGSTQIGDSDGYEYTYGTAQNLTAYSSLSKTGATVPANGWTFAGWSKNSSTGTTIHHADGASVSTETTTNNGTVSLYAVYKRTITVKGSATTSLTQYYNPSNTNPTAVTLPAITAITDWTANGYRTDTNNAVKTYNAGASVTPAANSNAPTYYAIHYRQKSITFVSGINKAMSKSKTGTAYYNVNNTSKPTSVTITTPKAGDSDFTAISNWDLYKWRTDSSNANGGVNPNTSLTVSFTDTTNTYYALYKKDYRASFAYGLTILNAEYLEGNVLYNTQTTSLPTTVNITLKANPSGNSVNYGWTALGWRKDSTAANKSYSFGQSSVSIDISTNSSNNNFNCVYSRTITLKYSGNSNSQGTIPSDQTQTQYYNTSGNVSSVVFTTTVPATTPQQFARYGYRFNGWYSSNHSATYTPGANSDGYSPAVDSTTTSYTLTASWTEKKYSWTIDPNGGTFEGSTDVVTKTNMSYNDKYFGTIPSPTKTGYRLKWMYYQDAVQKPTYATYTYNPNLTSAYINVVGMIPYNNSGSNYQFYNGSSLISTQSSWSNKPSSNFTKVTRGDLSISMASNDAYGATSTSRSPFGTYVMDVSNTSSGSGSPGYGGFQHHVDPAANGNYVHVFGALCGSGSYLHFTRNGLYTDGSSEDDYNAGAPTGWLTSNKCTGAWQIYMYRINMSSSPGGSMGYVYLSNVENNHTSTGITGHFSMKVGYSAIAKVNSQEWMIPQIDGSGSWRAAWIPNVYEVTLNSSSSGVTVTNAGTTKIYERYDDSYYKGYSTTSGMSYDLVSTSGNKIVKPVSSTHDFKGYYTGTNGSGVQVLDADGKMTTQAKAKEFSSNGTLYAKWTKKAVTTYSCRYRDITWKGSQWSCTPGHTYHSDYPSHCTSLYDVGYSYYGGSSGTSGECVCDKYYYVAWNPYYGSWSSYSNYTTYPQSTSSRQYQCQ